MVEFIMAVIHYGQNQLNISLLFLILHLNRWVYETRDRVWIPGNTFISNMHVGELPGIGEKVQADNPIFKGLKSPSIVWQLISAVGGAREGCPRSE